MKPDVIQTWMYHANVIGLIALLLSGRRSTTRIYWGIYCSEMDLTHYGSLTKMVVAAGARLSPLVDGIVYNSQAGMAAHRHLGFRDQNAVLIDNGVDTSRFCPNPEARVAVRRELGLAADAVVAIAVARDDPMKDWPSLLRALDTADGVEAILVGEGTERFLKAPRRRLLGRREDMPSLYAAADIFVMSSAFGEGASVALTEAMSSGLCSAVTHVGDNARLADGCGVVVPPRDSAALAAALRKLAADPGLRRKLAEVARKKAVDRFSIRSAAAAYSSLYAAGDVDPLAESRNGFGE
jgi:glycosyltransferase involved in cell wall biosynthesis